MIENIRDVPIDNREEFLREKNTVAAAESYLRRSLEALFDLGRHILARKFGQPATEYKEIAIALFENNVIGAEELALMKQMPGYRNGMVHFHHEISADELWDICAHHLPEIDLLLTTLVRWILSQGGNAPLRS